MSFQFRNQILIDYSPSSNKDSIGACILSLPTFGKVLKSTEYKTTFDLDF